MLLHEEIKMRTFGIIAGQGVSAAECGQSGWSEQWQQTEANESTELGTRCMKHKGQCARGLSQGIYEK